MQLYVAADLAEFEFCEVCEFCESEAAIVFEAMQVRVHVYRERLVERKDL